MASSKVDSPDVDEPVLPAKESWTAFFFNKKEKTVLGRTGLSWLKITIFYLIYYGCLAGWFAGLLNAFYLTLDDVAPRYHGNNSLTLNNPGLGMRPMPVVDLTLIRFRQGYASSYFPYTQHLKGFLDTYKFVDTAKPGESPTLPMDCPDGKQVKRNSSCEEDYEKCPYACAINVDAVLAEAGCAPPNFGYDMGEPCVLIKMNKLYGYEPIDHDNGMNYMYSNKQELMEAVAETKADRDNKWNIYKDAAPNVDYISLAEDGTSVGVSCDGQTALDRGHIEGIEFAPKNGLDLKFFPYKNQKFYRSPFVVFKFKVVKRELVQITCKLWAKNIDNSDGQEKRGSIHFELLID